MKKGVEAVWFEGTGRPLFVRRIRGREGDGLVTDDEDAGRVNRLVADFAVEIKRWW